MSSEEFYKVKLNFVFAYYLQMYVHSNKPKFYNIYLHQIYSKILGDKLLAIEFTEFLAEKMYLLVYDLEKIEVRKINEALMAELN